MDCLQCVRSKQWVGVVPLGLVMGGDPPPRPEGEEEEESLTARLTWPSCTQRAVRGTVITGGAETEKCVLDQEQSGSVLEKYHFSQFLEENQWRMEMSSA